MVRGRGARACPVRRAGGARPALVALVAFAFVAFALVALGPGATGASAQAPAAATGPRLWYEVTIGGAGMRLTCDLCQPARDVGPALTLAGGAQASPRLRVGIELSHLSYKDDAVRERLYGAGLVAQLTPDPARGLYLQAGLGWTRYRAGEFSYDAPRVTVALGWDVARFGAFAMGSVVALDAASFGSLKNGDQTVVENVGLSSVRAAVHLRRR